MDFEKAVITDIVSAITVFSKKNRHLEVKSRKTYGFSICTDGGQITYTQDGVKIVENYCQAVILPKGGSYSLHGDISGSFPVINFECLYPVTERVCAVKLSNPEFIIKQCKEIQKLYDVGGSRAKIFSLFYEILGELSSSEGSSIIDSAIRYIYDNYHDSGLTNATLAKKCNISEVYFRRLFKARYGTSPKQYILALRLQRAKQLLAEGKKKIAAIAVDCGFESSAHFSRTFKEQLGTTPGEYRQKHQVYEI